MSQRRAHKEAQRQVDDRVANLNAVLDLVCTGKVEAKPLNVLRWQIAPSWSRVTLPLRCDGMYLAFREEIQAVPTEAGTRLVILGFEYKVEATQDVLENDEPLLSSGWHFRYELDDNGPEHSFATSCVAEALRLAKDRRRPPYHMHVAEHSRLSDSLHYPIGEPSQPQDLVFEIIRLVKDEFVSY